MFTYPFGYQQFTNKKHLLLFLQIILFLFMFLSLFYFHFQLVT